MSYNGYVRNLLSQAKDAFRLSGMGGMGGFLEDWYQVNVKPSNWYDLMLDSGNLTRIEIDPQSMEVVPLLGYGRGQAEVTRLRHTGR